jgi:hypothetical protein
MFSQLSSQVDPEMQKRLEETAAAAGKLPSMADLGAFSKSINEVSLNLQAISKSMQDQQGYLNTTTQLQQQQVELSREAKNLEEEKKKALADIQSLGQKDQARRVKDLELTKEEDRIVRQARRGKPLSEQDQATFERLKRASAAGTALGQTGLNVAEAERIGGITPGEASVLTGGPERAKRILGVPTSEGLGAATSVLLGATPVRAALAAIAINQGLQGLESQGAAGFLSGIPLIGGQLSGMARQIPGLQPLTAFGETTRLGMVTGQGYRAGLGAQFQAFKLGANPFDIISQETATAIIGAVRSQGFRGQMAREFENSIRDIYKQTGLPVDQIAAIGELYARGGRLDQFRMTMESLDNIARDTNQSVATVAETMKSFNDVLVGQGGLANAPLVQAMTRLVSGMPGGAQAHAQFTQFFTQAPSAYTGLTPTAAATPAGQRMARPQEIMMLNSLRSTLQGLPTGQQDLLLGQMIDAGVLPGITSVNRARELLRSGPSALQNIGRTITRQNIEGAFSEADRARGQARHHPNLLGRAIGAGEYAVPGLGEFKLGERFGWWGHGPDRTGEREVYVKTLQQRLRSSHLSPGQISAVIDPLQRAARGHGDWGDTVKLAQARAEKMATDKQKGTIILKLDAAETKRLLGGKNVSKLVQLEDATAGTAHYVGTAFSQAF